MKQGSQELNQQMNKNQRVILDALPMKFEEMDNHDSNEEYRSKWSMLSD
jgi:hypothetical protein